MKDPASSATHPVAPSDVPDQVVGIGARRTRQRSLADDPTTARLLLDLVRELTGGKVDLRKLAAKPEEVPHA